MTPEPPTKEQADFTLTALKIIGYLGGGIISFVSGVVMATWIIRGKISGYDKKINDLHTEIKTVKAGQVKCQAEVLTNIISKIEGIPETVRYDLREVHGRIDDIFKELIKNR